MVVIKGPGPREEIDPSVYRRHKVGSFLFFFFFETNSVAFGVYKMLLKIKLLSQ